MAFEKDLAIANGDICFSCHDILIDDFDNPCECSHPVQCERCGRGVADGCWFNPKTGEVVYGAQPEASATSSSTTEEPSQ